jgi:MFS family permease
VTSASGRLTLSIYSCAFVVGGVLMGFEMLGSRYLFPYFGGGIGTWASLISTVLCALAIGYFIGSAIVARFPSQRTIAVSILVAAAYLAFVPASADPAMAHIMDSVGDGPSATLIASTALLLIPLTLLGTFSPVAVSLLTRSAEDAGRVAGLVYGVSTIGNVVGTLLTTFILIPAVGSRSITYIFAVLLALCAGILLLPAGKRPL